MRAMMAVGPAEYAAMLDAYTGTAVGDIIEGTEATTVIKPHLDAMQSNHDYIQVHTHPAGTTFSARDVALFTHIPNISIMVIVGSNAEWYVLIGIVRAPLAPDEVIIAYRQHLFTLGARYRALVDAGRRDRRSADRAGRHEAMRRLAVRLGLRYTRVGPPIGA